MSKHFPDGMFYADGMEIMMTHIIEAMECRCVSGKRISADLNGVDNYTTTCSRCAKLKELRDE